MVDGGLVFSADKLDFNLFKKNALREDPLQQWDAKDGF